MILVTGGTGLVGAHLIYELIKKGENVKAIYRDWLKVEAMKSILFSEEDAILFDKIDWMKADITDVPSLIEAFEDIRYVYHCAANLSFNPKEYQLSKKTNVEGTANIVNLCIANHVEKLCYVSSIATLDEKDNSLINEETDWNSDANNSIYSITKYGAEMEVWRGSQEGLNVVIVNPGVILGAGFWDSASGKIFTYIKNKFKFYTYGKVGFVDVLDVVKAMIMLTESKIVNQRYILVSENWVYKNFMEVVAQNLNVKPPSKEAKKWQLNLISKLDWLKSFLTGSQRKIVSSNVKSVFKKLEYSNEKITKDLNFTFTPIDQTIASICLKMNLL